jgi:ribonuclease HI
MNIEVYSDGSGNTFSSDGGCGWRIVIDGVTTHDGSCYLKTATNNSAEILSAIHGLEWVRDRRDAQVFDKDQMAVTLISDSQLVLGYASGRYQCRALHLTQLYIQLRSLYQELNCSQKWVKGHSGQEHNEAVDKLAKAAREGKGL